jgi:hypothetical protein
MAVVRSHSAFGSPVPRGRSRRWGWVKVLDGVSIEDAARRTVDLGFGPYSALLLTTKTVPQVRVALLVPTWWIEDQAFDAWAWARPRANRVYRALVAAGDPPASIVVVRPPRRHPMRPASAHGRPRVD